MPRDALTEKVTSEKRGEGGDEGSPTDGSGRRGVGESFLGRGISYFPPRRLGSSNAKAESILDFKDQAFP